MRAVQVIPYTGRGQGPGGNYFLPLAVVAGAAAAVSAGAALRLLVREVYGRSGVLPSTSMRPPDFLKLARSAAMRWLVRWAAELALLVEVRRSGGEVRLRAAGVAGVCFWVLLLDISTPVVVARRECVGGPAEGGGARAGRGSRAGRCGRSWGLPGRTRCHAAASCGYFTN